jgi:hypothetical protein
MLNHRIMVRAVGSLAVCAGLMIGLGRAQTQGHSYPWLERYDPAQSIASRLPAPAGFERMTVSTGSFGDWLRHLPLKPGTPEVFLFNGQKKANQSAHQAVIDIDAGNQDLQQCADAVIRLKAEYDFSRFYFEGIHFQFTSGDVVDFLRWSNGNKPVVQGNRVAWVKSEPIDWSYANFRKYLNTIFQYAGSISLSRELVPVKDVQAMRIGDVFIKGGSPGHAVIVVDMACDSRTGRRVFMIAQSFMPAQDIHVLKNLQDTRLSPWYAIEFGSVLATPEWTFNLSELKRFAD